MPNTAYRITRRFLDRVNLWGPFSAKVCKNSSALKAIPRQGKRIFQVIGLDRSGTTLLASKLSNHPKVICLIEPYFRWQHSGEILLDREVRPEWPENASGKLPHRLIAELCGMPQFELIGFKETFRGERWGHFSSEEFLMENVTGGCVDRTIAIVRNPKDNWSSHKKRQLKRTPPRPMEVNRKFTDRWNDFAGFIHKHAVFCVRYEDIVAQPEEEFRRIASYLDFDFCSEMLAPKAGQEDIEGLARARGVIVDTSVDRNSRDLAEEEVGFIERECGPLMAAFGYLPAIKRS